MNWMDVWMAQGMSCDVSDDAAAETTAVSREYRYSRNCCIVLEENDLC